MKHGRESFVSGGGLKVTVQAGAEGGEYVCLDVDGASVLLDDMEALKLSIWLDAARGNSRLDWSGKDAPDEDEDDEEPL